MDVILVLLLGLALLVAPIVLAVIALLRVSDANARARAAEARVRSLGLELHQLKEELRAASPPGAAPAEAPEAPTEAASNGESPEQAAAAGMSAAAASAAPTQAAARVEPERELQQGQALISVVMGWFARVFSSGANLARLGAALILAGIAFFLQYGTQSGLLPRGTRLVAATAAGLLLIFSGFTLRRTRRQIGLAMQGGGLAVLYAALFAGHNLLQLLPASPTFLGLALVSVAAVVLAYLNNSPALAFLSLVGGLAAPALVDAGDGNLSALFGYYLVLNLGVLASSILKGWRSVHTAAFILTMVTGGLVGGLRYDRQVLATAEPFLILFFLIYFASTLALAYRYPEKPLPLGNTVTLPVMTLVLQAGILEGLEHGLGTSAAVLAVLYLGTAWLAHRLQVPGWVELGRVFVPIGVGLSAAVFPLWLEPDLTGVLWALQGASLMWVAKRYELPWMRLFGVTLLALAGLSVLWEATWFGLIVWGVSMTASGYALRGKKGEAPATVLGGVALLLGAHQTADAFLPRVWAPGAALFLGGLFLAAVYLLSRRWDWGVAGRGAALLAGGAALLFPLVNSFDTAPLFGVAALGYALMLGLVFLVQRDAGLGMAGRVFLALALAWAPVMAVGWSLLHWLDHTGWRASGWTLAVMAPLAVLGLLLARASWRDRIWRLEGDVRQQVVLIPVVAAIAVATLLASVGGPVRQWHLPLLNPADLAVALGVTVLALHWGGTRRALEDWRLWGIVALGVLGVTTAMTRGAAAYFGVPYTLGAALSSTGLQAAISLLWSGLALVMLAFARRQGSRIAWRTGLGLLGLTTLKLLLVDFAGAGTLARIISFVGVGILFLAVAFLMPAPNGGDEMADGAKN